MFYVAHRQTKNITRARQLTEDVLGTFSICSLTDAMLRSALAMPILDYEDAIQAFSALAEGLDCIITRDVKGFENSPVRAITPVDFITELNRS